jgi:tripartite-type tricarboxylate transporter receptor subunit TctC
MLKKNKASFTGGMIFALAILALPVLSPAEFPDKPITIIVPWAPGGTTDLAARTLAGVAGSQHLPVPVAVINRPGAGGSIGTNEVVKAKPDGYTLGLTTGSCLVIEPHLRKLPYTSDDYVPIMQVFLEESIVAAHPSKPYNTMKEFVAYAKANPKQVNAGIHAPYTTGHMAFLQVQVENNIELKIVPMGGGGPMKTGLLGGHIDVAPLGIAESLPYVKAKQMKNLCLTGSKGHPEVPPDMMCEKQGYHIIAPVVGVLVAPKGTPPDKIKTLHDGFKKAMDDPTFKKIAKGVSLEVEYLDSLAARNQLNRYYKHYGDLIKRLGMGKEKK